MTEVLVLVAFHLAYRNGLAALPLPAGARDAPEGGLINLNVAQLGFRGLQGQIGNLFVSRMPSIQGLPVASVRRSTLYPKREDSKRSAGWTPGLTEAAPVGQGLDQFSFSSRALPGL